MYEEMFRFQLIFKIW